jgi:hypothetical protein
MDMNNLATERRVSGGIKMFSINARASDCVDVICYATTSIVFVQGALVVVRSYRGSGDAIVLATILVMNLIDVVVVVSGRISAETVLVVDRNRVLTSTVEFALMLIEVALVGGKCCQSNSLLHKLKNNH